MATYQFTLSNGKTARVTANSEDEARRKKADYEAKLNPEPKESPSGGSVLRAALSKTGLNIASTLPESMGGGDPEVFKKALAPNKQILEDAGGYGTAADIGVQAATAFPAAAAAAYGGTALATAAGGSRLLAGAPTAARYLSKALKGGSAIAGASAESALLEDAGSKGNAAALGGGIQAIFEAIPGVGKAVKAVGGAEKVTNLIRQGLKKIAEENPGISKTEMAKRLEEIVGDLDLPLANSARSELVRRVAAISEYFPMSGARETHAKATERIREKFLDVAEGGAAPPKIGPPAEPDKSIYQQAKSALFGKDDPYTRSTQERLRNIQDSATKEYDRIINDRDFDPEATFRNVAQGMSQNSDPFVREMSTSVSNLLKKSINADTGKVSGRSIGNLKAELRDMVKDSPPHKQQAIRDVVKQIDADISKQLSPDDAAKWADLNATHPDRVIAQESMADVPLGEFDPTVPRKALEGQSTSRQLARGEGRNQEMVDLGAAIMKRKPPDTSSPWAMAALITSAVTFFAPVLATTVGKTQVAKAIRNGTVPDALKNNVEFSKLREMAKKMDDSELIKMLEKAMNARGATGTFSGVAGAELTE